MTDNSALSADDWIKAAFQALASGGVRAIRVEAIARDLKVSKGSFYWHFKDVVALKKAMLWQWIEKATKQIVASDVDTSLSAQDRLLQFVLDATSDESLALGGDNMDAAIREWARFDSPAALALKFVYIKRAAYLTELFEKCEHSMVESRLKSRLLYGVLVGLATFPDDESASRQTEGRALLTLLLRKE
jgi:AcrR family transcriptional regulator